MKTCHDTPRLGQITQAQSRALNELGIANWGSDWALCITGIVKAFNDTHAFLIDRDGSLKLKFKRGRG